MQVSNKKTNIILIVGIIIILGGYFIYNNFDKIKKSLDETTTSSIEKIKEVKETFIYECPDGFTTDEEVITENTICAYSTEVTYDNEYYCPSGSSPKEGEEMDYFTKCYYDEVISPNACPTTYYDNGSTCVSEESSDFYDIYMCSTFGHIWQDDGCHRTTSYICPSGYETNYPSLFGERTCTKVTNSIESFHCDEGTYNPDTNRCIVQSNAIKKDI